MKVIYIKWFDANFDNGGYKKENLPHKEIILESIGIYIDEDKKYITLANEYMAEYKKYKYIHNIPKVNIIKKKMIKL